MVALLFSRGRFAPGFWLGFVLIVLFHELGHAYLSHRRGLAVFEIQVHGLGGVCVHAPGSEFDGAFIAWGGVLAEILILIPAVLVDHFVPYSSPFVAELIYAFTYTNLYVIGFNLIPIAPLDGHRAWKLPGLWRARRGERNAAKQRKKQKAQRRVDAANAERDARDLARAALDAAKRGDET